MDTQIDEIVDIPANRIKYFGGPGKMLLPSPATVAALVAKVPERQLVTTELLRQALTDQFEVQGTCPVTTQRALQTLASQPNQPTAYWRVVNSNGGLVARFPGGVEGHAARLRREGFEIDRTGKAPKVKHFSQRLVGREVLSHHSRS